MTADVEQRAALRSAMAVFNLLCLMAGGAYDPERVSPGGPYLGTVVRYGRGTTGIQPRADVDVNGEFL